MIGATNQENNMGGNGSTEDIKQAQDYRDFGDPLREEETWTTRNDNFPMENNIIKAHGMERLSFRGQNQKYEVSEIGHTEQGIWPAEYLGHLRPRGNVEKSPEQTNEYALLDSRDQRQRQTDGLDCGQRTTENNDTQNGPVWQVKANYGLFPAA